MTSQKFGIIYGIWFLSTPVLLVVSTMLDDWVRMKVVISMGEKELQI